MHHVYTGTYLNATYVGRTKNLTKRLYTHKSRFYENMDGSDYFVYIAWRRMTESFDKIEWKIVKSFNSEKLAKEYEIKLIKEIGNLNETHSEMSNLDRFELLSKL